MHHAPFSAMTAAAYFGRSELLPMIKREMTFIIKGLALSPTQVEYLVIGLKGVKSYRRREVSERGKRMVSGCLIFPMVN